MAPGASGGLPAQLVHVPRTRRSLERSADYDAANTTKLKLTGSSLALAKDFVSNNALYNATLITSGSDIVVTFGTVISGTIKTGARKAKMTWTPSTAATDLAGNPCAATVVIETGANDRDF